MIESAVASGKQDRVHHLRFEKEEHKKRYARSEMFGLRMQSE